MRFKRNDEIQIEMIEEEENEDILKTKKNNKRKGDEDESKDDDGLNKKRKKKVDNYTLNASSESDEENSQENEKKDKIKTKGRRPKYGTLFYYKALHGSDLVKTSKSTILSMKCYFFYFYLN